MLKPGNLAPDFDAETTAGGKFQLSAERGHIVVIYFFPRAFTPACNVETKGFRDNYPELHALGVEVVGVSTDPIARSCRFAEKHQVRFPMISDGDKMISRAYGVLWPLLPMAQRVTFVIDPFGIVRGVFHHEFQISKHLDEVVKFARDLASRTRSD
ncbi:MAG: peroxiredoxin [Polyangiaceae bacterium]